MALVFRFFWAVILSLVVVIAFLRSWDWEHGGRRRKWQEQNETVVYISPLIFPIAIGFSGALNLLLYGISGGIVHFAMDLADIFMCMSVYFIILLVLLPFLRKRFSARACALLWSMPIFLFYQPHIILSDTAYTPAHGGHMHAIYVPSGMLHGFAYLWATVFVLFFGWQIFSNFLFRRKLMTDARPVEEAEILEIWDRERRRLHYGKPIQLLYSPNATTPLSMGTRNKNRVTFLPERDFTADELELIFRHELHHVQRRDVDTKVFLGFCKALFWFNPLTWIAVRKASDDLELACDEIALRKAGDSERRKYAQLLLCAAGSSRGFSTCLSASADSLRYRLKNVVEPGKRRVGAFLLATAIFFCCMSYGSIVFVSERGTIGELDVLGNAVAADICELSFYDNDELEEPDMRSWYELDSCGDDLLFWLNDLKVEKLFSGSTFDESRAPEFSCCIRTGEREVQVTLNDDILEISDSEERGVDYYLVCSEIRWDDAREWFKAGQ